MNSVGPVGFPRLTPADCVQHLEALERAISALEHAGVRIADSGRLFMSRKILQKVVEQDRFPDEVEERRTVANAIRDAAEFGLIATALGEDRAGVLARELQRGVGGTVTQDEETREPYQFQAQYFFGALLTAAEINLQVAGGASPDFLVENGNRVHGIEIKRPESERGLARALGSGADQLRRVDRCGMLVVDLSEIIQSDLPRVTDVAEDPDPWRTAFEDEFRERTDALEEEILSNSTARKAKDRYASIIALATFARGWAWVKDGQSIWPAFQAAFYWCRFYSTPGNLGYHRAGWMGDKLEEALEWFIPDLELTRTK